MERQIAIIDRGRGPQLSTSRITVQDLFPYLELGYTPERIIEEAMPSLTLAEIEAVRQYVDEHQEEVREQDRLIRQRNATRKNPPSVEAVLRQGREHRLAWLERRGDRNAEAANGDGHSG